MDVCSKLLSRMVTTRLYKSLDRYGTKCQFGATPGVGCQDGSFTLKSLLHLRRQHSMETFVAFVDLVKAFDTVDHELLLKILERFGIPPKMINVIKRLYTDLKVILKIGKESAEMSQTIGVRQGDNMSPVLFLFVMAAFAETLEIEWEKENIPKVEFHHTPFQQIAQGQLISHPANKLSS